MSFEVCQGQCLLFNGTEYPAGSLVPTVPNQDELLRLNVIREVPGPPKPRPKPVAKKKPAPKKKAAPKKES